MKGPTFRRWRCSALFQIWAALICWMLKKKRPYNHYSPSKYFSLLLRLLALPGRGAEPDTRCPVPCSLAGSVTWKRHSTPPAQMTPVPNLLATHLPPALPHQGTGWAWPTAQAMKEPKWGRQLGDREAGASEMLASYTVVWQMCCYSMTASPSPLPERLFPVLKIHWAFFFTYSTFRGGLSSLCFSWAH